MTGHVEIMKGDVESLIVTTLAEQADSLGSKQDVGRDTLIVDLALDSLAVMESVYEIEDHLHVTLRGEQLSKLHTVGDMIEAVLQELKIRASDKAENRVSS